MATNSSSRLLALLGLLAVAGYQNRDRIGEWLGKSTRGNEGDALQRPAGGPSTPGAGDALGNLVGGLRDLIDRFTASGQGDNAKSWIETGPNRNLDASALENALGNDTIDELVKQTGLSRDELLSRLKSVLPDAVDRMTPEGRIPTEAEFTQSMGR